MRFSPASRKSATKRSLFMTTILTALVEGQITEVPETWSLEYLSVTSGNQTVPTATVRLQEAGRKTIRSRSQDAGIGDGPVDAALKAIDRLTKTRGKLMDYSLRAVSPARMPSAK